MYGLPSRERAQADFEEVVQELLDDGFREVALGAGEGPYRDLPRTPPTLVSIPPAATDGTRHFAEAIIARCRQRGWFGHDMALKIGQPDRNAIEWRRFRHAPATEAQLVETERRLGFPLPPALRTIFGAVANGGFGPGYGFVGVIGGAPDSLFETDLADAYKRERETSRLEDPFEEWPRRVLRVLEWGCGIWSCIDARSGQVLRYESGSGDPASDMTPEAESVEEWIERWLRGENLFHLGGHSGSSP